MMGFNLYQLVNVYIKSLSGTSYSRKHQCPLPIWQVYDDVVTFLNSTKGEKEDTWKSVRDKILNEDSSLAKAPQEYWNILMVFDLGYTLREWDELSIQDQARCIAVRYLKNMAEVLDAYYEEMKARQKKIFEKNGR